MTAPEESLAIEGSRWNWWRLIWNTAIVGVVYIATQVLVVIASGIISAISDPEFDIIPWAQSAGSDGFLLSVASCATAFTCVPLIRLLTGRFEKRPWDFLGFRRVPARQIFLSCVVMAFVIALSDFLTLSLGRPLVPPFMLAVYETARFPLFLFVALVVAAPIVEELLFRGFLFGCLRACGATVVATIVIVSLAFAVVHVQYDLYDVSAVFVMGLVFAGARARFNSIIPGIAMHSLANAVAFIEVVLIRSGRL